MHVFFIFKYAFKNVSSYYWTGTIDKVIFQQHSPFDVMGYECRLLKTLGTILKYSWTERRQSLTAVHLMHFEAHHPSTFLTYPWCIPFPITFIWCIIYPSPLMQYKTPSLLYLFIASYPLQTFILARKFKSLIHNRLFICKPSS